VKHKDKENEQPDSGQWPILSVRVPHDIKRTLDSLRKATNRKFQPTEFVREAIVQKLEREFSSELLRKHGYIYLERRETN